QWAERARFLCPLRAGPAELLCLAPRTPAAGCTAAGVPARVRRGRRRAGPWRRRGGRAPRGPHGTGRSGLRCRDVAAGAGGTGGGTAMLSFPPVVRIWLATAPTDLR